MNLGMIAVFLVIIIVIGSILTRKCEPFLIGGSIAGAVFLYRQNFLPQWVTILENVMMDTMFKVPSDDKIKTCRITENVVKGLEDPEYGYERVLLPKREKVASESA